MDCTGLPFSEAELQLFRAAATAGVSTVAILGAAFASKLLFTWLAWRR